jgi:hypothetical protein
MKYVLPIIAAVTLAGCSSGNDPAQQAQIERTEAETEKLRAETQQVQSENAARDTLASMSYAQASRCAALAGYFRDKRFDYFSEFMRGSGNGASSFQDYLNATIAISRNFASTKAETMNPRPDVERDTGAAAVQSLANQVYITSPDGSDSVVANLLEEMKGVCRPVWETSEFRNPA